MIDKQYLNNYKKFEYLFRERKILIELSQCDFVAQLFTSFESSSYFNFLFEYYPGGEIFFHLKE